MSFQNIVWFTWPPPLLRTAVRMSSGTVRERADQLLGALALQLRVLLERGVQVVHVGLMMLAVVDLHRLRVDVRLERGEVIGQGWQLMGHCTLLDAKRPRRIDVRNGM